MILYFWQKLFNSIDLNACALSVTNFREHPNLDIIFSNRNLIITFSVAFLVGTASTHLVK